MRIAILAYPLRVAGGLSVGRNVIAALSRVADQHEYLLLMPAGVGYEQAPKPSHCEAHYYARTRGALGQALYEWREAPRLTRAFRPDVVWGLGNFGFRRPGAKQAILFHKPQFIYEPRYTRVELPGIRLRNALARGRLLRSLPATQLVFCQTKTAAERFRRFLGYRGEIALMPNAVSRFAMGDAAGPPPAVFERLRGRFTLFCLTKYYAHKNLEAFVELFQRRRDELRDVSVLLTITAAQHPRAPRFVRTISAPELREHIVNVGPVEQRDLAAYYGASDGLILPTLLESFSGTYLEAMQFRRPILTSDMDFARDVCGAAAEYFDPFDPGSICAAIRRVRDSAERRAELIAAGAERLERFVRDWDSIVAEAVGALERL
jgi:glycosyltransferase involved in cell wall biosynthesis